MIVITMFETFFLFVLLPANIYHISYYLVIAIFGLDLDPGSVLFCLEVLP